MCQRQSIHNVGRLRSKQSECQRCVGDGGPSHLPSNAFVSTCVHLSRNNEDVFAQTDHRSAHTGHWEELSSKSYTSWCPQCYSFVGAGIHNTFDLSQIPSTVVALSFSRISIRRYGFKSGSFITAMLTFLWFAISERLQMYLDFLWHMASHQAVPALPHPIVGRFCSS